MVQKEVKKKNKHLRIRSSNVGYSSGFHGLRVRFTSISFASFPNFSVTSRFGNEAFFFH